MYYLLQLKLYAERGNLGKSNLILGDTYSAKAYNDKALRAVLERDKSRIINIIICASIFVVFFSFVIVIILMITFFCSNSHTKSKWIENVKEKKPVVLSLTVLSGITNAYIASLASSALRFWYNSSDKEDILHTNNTRINAAPLFTVIVTDAIALISWSILVLVAGCIYCKMVNKNPKDNSECSLWCTLRYHMITCYTLKCCGKICCKCHKPTKCKIIKHKYSYSMSTESAFIILSATVLCPIFCIIAHSPYIAIAYLNDGDHASSMFIYYTVLFYLLFGVIWLFFHWCQHFLDEMTQNTKNNNQDNSNEKKYRVLGCCTIGEIERGTRNEATSKEQRHCFITAVIILIFVALLFLLGLIVVISCYFVLIPINKSISNAPNRLLSIYQSGGFLIGTFIVFNILKYFHAQSKKKDIGENVDKIHVILQNWPLQQLYRLQEQLNKLERKSDKVQIQLSTEQGTPNLPSKSLQKIRDLKNQLQQFREELDLLKQQSESDPPERWGDSTDRLTHKFDDLQEKLNRQERECQQ